MVISPCTINLNIFHYLLGAVSLSVVLDDATGSPSNINIPKTS